MEGSPTNQPAARPAHSAAGRESPAPRPMSLSLRPAQLPPVPPGAHFGDIPPATPQSPALTHSSTLRKASGSFTTRKVPAEASCGQRQGSAPRPLRAPLSAKPSPAKPSPAQPGSPRTWSTASMAPQPRGAEPSGGACLARWLPPGAGMRGAVPAQAGRSSRAGPAPPAPPRGAAPALLRAPAALPACSGLARFAWGFLF